ncbi:MAG: extracellular solute-binding protein [Bacteroidales bacterium]|nr:extracellular solute-binding protein [Bacteroidales bacterium]
MKKLFITSLLFFTAFILFAGGQQETGEADGPITLTVWDFKYGDEATRVAMDKVDAAFMAANPGIIIDHQPQPNDNYYDLLKVAAASNSGPDVALVHGDKGEKWELAEVLVGLDSSISAWKGDIGEIAWNASRAFADPANPIDMIPMTQQGFGMYYNKELFAKAGLDPENPPTSEKAFLNACEKLKASGIIPLAEQMKGYPKSMMYMTRMLLANAYGPELSRTEINYTDPQVVAIVNFFVTLKDKGYYDPDALSLGYWGDVLPKFQNGEVAIIYGLLSDTAHWKMFSDSLGKDNVGYFPNINLNGFEFKDQQNIAGAGIGYSVFKWSKNKDAAIAYASFYGQTEGASILMNELGAMSPNKNVSLEKFDYPVLKDVIRSMDQNPVLGSTPSLPGVAQKAFEQEQSMLLMLGEITTEEFIKTTQSILESERASQ